MITFETIIIFYLHKRTNIILMKGLSSYVEHIL
jgi:hypothetical protein